ncbi:MAG: tRNA (guanosine(46)-N7)-methyltransferase TrmB [Clostridia bacterium]|jgi:tRNA (guanine-N7-)-methyltransferase|nr:tRNA (guanosine(46)-N7)-methyltransferase TrmB [Clostridia bacterium]
MRVRRVNRELERLENFKGHLYIDNIDEFKEKIKDKKCIHIEVGTGKGQFITTLAERNKDIFYVGIELKSAIVAKAVQKAIDKGVENVVFLDVNGEHLLEWLEEGNVDRVYLNFSDPWPKPRHYKKRLTYRSFQDVYSKLLKEGGELHFKTDNKGLFEYSINEIIEYDKFDLKKVWLDLHSSDFEGNAMTEYEEKFSSEGMPIYRLEAIRRDI